MPTKTYDPKRVIEGPAVPEYLREFARQVDAAPGFTWSASSISSEST